MRSSPQPRCNTGTVIATAGRSVTVALSDVIAYVNARTIPFCELNVGDTVNLARLRATWVCLGRADAPVAEPRADAEPGAAPATRRGRTPRHAPA